MRKAFKTGMAIALMALTACSPRMDDAVYVEEPVIVEAPVAPVENRNTCDSTGIDDGIGGTGCPAPID